MKSGYAKKADWLLATALTLNILLAADIIFHSLSAIFVISVPFIFILMLCIFTCGCTVYIEGKGYSPAFGILGCFYLVGLFVLTLFPDRHKTTGEPKKHYCTTSYPMTVSLTFAIAIVLIVILNKLAAVRNEEDVTMPISIVETQLEEFINKAALTSYESFDKALVHVFSNSEEVNDPFFNYRIATIYLRVAKKIGTPCLPSLDKIILALENKGSSPSLGDRNALQQVINTKNEILSNEGARQTTNMAASVNTSNSQ